MSFTTGSAADEMSQAEALPQLDASALVDGERLEAEVKDVYCHVAREEGAELHFELGRGRAERLGSPSELLDAIPAEALASFAGVGITSTSPRSSLVKPRSTSAPDPVPTSSARRCWSATRVASSGWTSPTSSSTRPRAFGTERVLAGRARRSSHRGAPVR